MKTLTHLDHDVLCHVLDYMRRARRGLRDYQLKGQTGLAGVYQGFFDKGLRDLGGPLVITLKVEGAGFMPADSFSSTVLRALGLRSKLKDLEGVLSELSHYGISVVAGGDDVRAAIRLAEAASHIKAS